MENNNLREKLCCEGKPKVAFICNHNSCRSQMAEALGKLFASDVFDSYSAGTIIKSQINQDAVRLIKEIYSVDMEKTQFNKKLEEIPAPDIAIFMGCNVSCPMLKAKHSENWGLDDPSGKNDEEFKIIINTIEENVKRLALELSK
ncbi:MAG: arsenate reductase ArsC [Bacillota bacterium]